MKKCPICNKKTEDMRHVSVECFYDVQEAVPEAEEKQVFVEVPLEKTYWGITRRYPSGLRDNPSPEIDPNKENAITLKNNPTPIPEIRLFEKSEYMMRCCKSCRADFLGMLGKWYRGELIAGEEHPADVVGRNVPIRVNGVVKYVTEEEWHAMKNKRGV